MTIDLMDLDLPERAIEAINARVSAREELTNNITTSIHDYNAQNPDEAIHPGCESWIHQEAKRVFVGNQIGQPDPGWIRSLRDKPEFANFFALEKPGSNGRTIDPKAMGGTLQEREAAIAVKYGL